jgi:hypothetical protein
VISIYSLFPTTFFPEIFLIFSSISHPNKSRAKRTHFSTEFTLIFSTFLSLSKSGTLFATCTSSQGLTFISSKSGQNVSSKTISHQTYQTPVTCCTFTASLKTSSQCGISIPLTSQIPGIDLIIFLNCVI